MAVEEQNQFRDLLLNIENLVQSVIGRKYYKDAKRFAIDHPFVFATILGISAFASVPFLFFLGFAVFTLFISLICFLCIEGSLIAIAGAIFLGVLTVITVIVGSILASVASAYWIARKMCSGLSSVRCSTVNKCIFKNCSNSVDDEEEEGDKSD